MKIRILTLGILLGGAAIAAATPAEPAVNAWREQVRIALENTLDHWSQAAHDRGESLQYTISMADERLRFTPCGTVPAVSSRSTANSGRLTFAVSCPGPQAWQLHVPVKVDRFARVAVARHPLIRRNALHESDIDYRLTNTGDLPSGYYKEGSPLGGLVAKRSLPAGTVLHPGLLEAPLVVRKGEQVVISAGNTAIRVRMDGLALADGRLGEQIDVQNLASQRRIKAFVIGRANVEVPL